MAKRSMRYRHRKPHFLRATAIIAWALQGVFMPWIQTPVYAANLDTIRLGVRATSSAPPAAVADLMASVNLMVPGEAVLTWTAPQGNAGGTPINNVTVESYTVRYATFSADSLGGNTTSWWNSPGTVSTTLQPPSYNPKAPGNLEVYIWNPLPAGTTLYFALKSTSPWGILSPIDTNANTTGQQAHALIPGTISAPSSFKGKALSSSSIQWSWSSVAGATGYFVYSDPADVLLQTLLAPTTFWTEAGLSINAAYSRKVQATDGTSNSGFSGVATTYTLAVTPASLAVTGTTSSSISLSWNANGNPAGTSFALERSPDGSTFNPLITTASTTTVDTGLTANTIYYYRLRALNGDNIATAYTPTVSAVTNQSSGATPQRPNGVLSTVISNGNQVLLNWSPVTQDTSRNPISIDHYLVQRYLTIGATPTVSVIVPAPGTTYTDTNNAADYFYTIQAVSTSGGMSAFSDYLDALGNRYAIASDDLTTRVVMPHDAALYLLKNNNPYGDDMELVLTRQPQNEINVTLRSYLISARKASTGETITPFAFPLADTSVQLGYGAVIGSPRYGLATHQLAQTTAGSIAQIISVFWFNGSSFIRISDPVLTSGQAIAVTVRNLGIYEIRAVTIGVAFRLTQGSPYPRVITPNGAENHRVFFFFENPMDESVSGTIYDIRGAKVRTLQVNSMSPSSNSLVWDGKDSQGSVVPSGVYLYKITAGNQTVTGTVVVAR